MIPEIRFKVSRQLGHFARPEIVKGRRSSMLPSISTDGLYRLTELETASEGYLIASLDFLVLLGANGSYPSHFLPVEVHLLQLGFVSSHFTRRILMLRCIRMWRNLPNRETDYATERLLASNTATL